MQIDFTSLRKHEETAIVEEHTIKWFSELAIDKRPVNLIKDYPRIANRIAAYWHDSNICQKYLRELLMDPERLSRKGFPFAVANEISDLNNILAASITDPTIHKDGIFRS